METYFHLNSNITILFRSWQVKSEKGLALYLVLIFALAVALESIRGLLMYFVFELHMKAQNACATAEQLQALKRKRLIKHAIASLIYMVQLTFGYLLMLAVMTFNVIVFLTVIAGIVTGYFLANPLIVRGIEAAYLKKLERTTSDEYPRKSKEHIASEEEKQNMITE